MSTRDLIFLDTETTGLNFKRHSIWEVAWAVNGGPIQVAQVPHGLEDADPAALRINGYLDRVSDNRETVMKEWSVTIMPELDRAFAGSHLVGSNPTFDATMLAKTWFPNRPWHHRLIDITPMAMVLFGWERPQGMATIATKLRAEGFTVDEPDHTAVGDVHVLRQAYDALREVADR